MRNFKKQEKVVDQKAIEAVERFEVYLEVERNASDYTIKNYLKDIKMFSEYLENEDFGSILEYKVKNVPRYYLAYLVSENYSKTSINRMISSLRSMYRYFLEK